MNNKYKNGFTLIELMIVVAIVAILAAIAYPSYKSSILKGKRAQARTALVELLQQQERYMTQRNCYLGFTNLIGTATATAAPECGTTAATPVPFKVFSGDTPTSTAYWLFADACPTGAAGAANMLLNECVRINARPVIADPEVDVLRVTSTGIKGLYRNRQRHESRFMLAMKYSPNPSRGFTLIELMVTLAIAAILMMVAVPSLVTYKRNAELTSATNTLLAAINAARGEAMKRGTNAIMAPTDGKTWSNGWRVFVYVYAAGRDTGADGFTYDAAFDKLIMEQPALPSYLSVSGNNNTGITKPYIMYDASGYSRTKGSGLKNTTLNISRNDVSSTDQIRRITIAITGRARTCNPATDTTCTATADSP